MYKSVIIKTLQMPVFWFSVLVVFFFGGIIYIGSRPEQHPTVSILIYLWGFVAIGVSGMIYSFFQSRRVVTLQKRGKRVLAKLLSDEHVSFDVPGLPGGFAGGGRIDGGVLSKMRYEYEVDGKTFQNKTYPISTSVITKAATQPIYIFYDPANPSSSVWEGE